MLWWCIFLFLGGAALTLNLHELSHCVVVWLTGGQITDYSPYPHTKYNRFYFGSVGINYHNMIPDAYRYSHIAPLLKSLFFLALWIVLGTMNHTPLLILAAWELIDILWWFVGYFFDCRSDGGRWRDREC